MKGIVFLLMIWFIINQLFFKNDIGSQWQMFLANFQGANVLFLLAAILLMPLNWILETIKWRWLIRSSLPFLHLLKSIISGITLGFVTPGRSGEFLGRAIYLEEEDRPRVLFLAMIGGIAHTAVTLAAGSLFISYWTIDMFWSELALGGAVFFLLFFFRFDLFNRLLANIPLLSKNNIVLPDNDLPALPTQLNVLLITIVRYFVYVSQYNLIEMFLGVHQNFLTLMVYNSVFFLLQTFSPLMPFLDISVRGGIALFVFATLTSNNIAVLTSVTAAWLLNLVIPALIGYLFILNRRILAYV